MKLEEEKVVEGKNKRRKNEEGATRPWRRGGGRKEKEEEGGGEGESQGRKRKKRKMKGQERGRRRETKKTKERVNIGGGRIFNLINN